MVVQFIWHHYGLIFLSMSLLGPRPMPGEQPGVCSTQPCLQPPGSRAGARPHLFAQRPAGDPPSSLESGGGQGKDTANRQSCGTAPSGLKARPEGSALFGTGVGMSAAGPPRALQPFPSALLFAAGCSGKDLKAQGEFSLGQRQYLAAQNERCPGSGAGCLERRRAQPLCLNPFGTWLTNSL